MFGDFLHQLLVHVQVAVFRLSFSSSPKLNLKSGDTGDRARNLVKVVVVVVVVMVVVVVVFNLHFSFLF